MMNPEDAAACYIVVWTWKGEGLTIEHEIFNSSEEASEHYEELLKCDPPNVPVAKIVRLCTHISAETDIEELSL
jgi:hypothetical protein